MKKFIFFLAIVMLCSSCSNSEQDNLGRFNDASALFVLILDAEGNNRLDPQSPAFWGNEFIQGTTLQVFGFVEGGVTITLAQFLAQINRTFIPLGTGSVHDHIGDIFSYIRYPDGSYDQIRTRTLLLTTTGGSTLIIYKIWVNGELAYHHAGGGKHELGFLTCYFNPTFFPELVPVYYDGNQIGIAPSPDLTPGGMPLIITR